MQEARDQDQKNANAEALSRLEDKRNTARQDFKAGKISREQLQTVESDFTNQRKFVLKNGRLSEGATVRDVADGNGNVLEQAAARQALLANPSLRNGADAEISKSLINNNLDNAQSKFAKVATVNTNIVVNTAATDPNAIASKVAERAAREIKATVGAQ